MSGKTIKLLIEDPYRNRLIIDETIRLYKLGMNVYVFSEYRDHIKYLAEELHELLEGNMSLVQGGIGKKYLEIAIGKQIILTTHSYSTTGVSIKRMNALIIGTPRKAKTKQLVGRITRIGSSNEQRVIIDIVDNIFFLKKQYNIRKSTYKEKEFNIIEQKISYKSLKPMKQFNSTDLKIEDDDYTDDTTIVTNSDDEQSSDESFSIDDNDSNIILD